jgi:fibronectin type 3 domain-containing protein
MNGCWDWIGWYGNDFDVKTGKQLSTMKKMIDRIVSGFNPIDPLTELQVTDTTNHSVSLSWKQVSGATSYNIYRNDQKANVNY